MKSATWATWSTTSALLVLLATSPAARSQKPIEVFDAQAVNLNATAGQGTGPVQIQITRWSTDTELGQVNAAIAEGGGETLMKVLTKLESVGAIRTPATTGYELRFARKTSAGGNEQILIMTDRPLGFTERAEGARSVDYPFSVIELRLRPGGQGEGKMAVAARVNFNKLTKSLELENYTVSPITLQNVRRVKGSSR